MEEQTKKSTRTDSEILDELRLLLQEIIALYRRGALNQFELEYREAAFQRVLKGFEELDGESWEMSVRRRRREAAKAKAKDAIGFETFATMKIARGQVDALYCVCDIFGKIDEWETNVFDLRDKLSDEEVLTTDELRRIFSEFVLNVGDIRNMLSEFVFYWTSTQRGETLTQIGSSPRRRRRGLRNVLKFFRKKRR